MEVKWGVKREVKGEVKMDNTKRLSASPTIVLPACWLNFLRKAHNSLFNSLFNSRKLNQNTLLYNEQNG